MTETNRDDAERLIVKFLDEHEHPTRAEWTRLIDAHPEHARYFLDAALVREVGDAADARDVEVTVDPLVQSTTLSYALSKLHQMGSPALEAAQSAINGVKRPAERRRLADQLGIGAQHVVLLNSVLAGRTRAPLKVLRLLSEAFNVQMMALREVFTRAFSMTAVPSYKSSNEKPNVPLEPVSWEDEVRDLRASRDETVRLLEFAEEEPA